jgi:adenylate cyclase
LSIFSELKRRNVLRVGAAYLTASWLLIQIADALFPIFELPEVAGRILVVVLAIGFVPALLAAWLFEITPEGIKRESDAIHASAESVRATRRFDRTIIAVLTLAVVVFAVDRFLIVPARDARLVAEATEQARNALRAGPSGDDERIAVLAFDDLSQDGDQEYLSDGISVELMDLLARIPGLVVTAPNSALSFKGKNIPYPEIGATLNVGHLLDGTVRVAGDRVRVTARLIDAATGNQVWSYTPETRPMTDVFAIQDEIASDVVEQLKITLAGELPTLDETTPEVHTLLLQARQIGVSRLREGVPLQVELLEQAVDLDDHYLPARIALAIAYRQLGNPGEGQIEMGEARRLMRETIEAAASIWPDRVEIKQMRAFIAADTGEFATAARYLEAALVQDPSHHDTLVLSQGMLVLLGRFEQSIAVGERVVARDPLCGFCYANLIWGYFETRRFDEAVEVGRKAEALRLGSVRWRYGASLLFSGRAEAALAAFQEIGGGGGFMRLAGPAMAFHELGRTQEFETAMAELNEITDGCYTPCSLVYAYIGDKDTAFEYLNGMPIPDDPTPEQRPALSAPFYDPLRDDPRWEEFARKWPEDPREQIPFSVEFPE